MKERQLCGPETLGTVYNIQRYNLHDGPGIRTIIFLKGCSLGCPWCANPESQNPSPQMMDGEMVGYRITAKEAIDKAARDIAFFKRSGGGITISGGEAVAQPDFTAALAAEAKNRGIHVTVETACCTDWETIRRVTQQVDVVLADVKLMDSKRHLEVTGMPNEGILENIRWLAASGKHVIVRVPVIPGYNADRENLRKTAGFCKEAGITEINLLPYHEMGVNKYKKLGMEYRLNGVRPPAKAVLIELAGKVEQEFGIEIKVL